MNPDGDHQSGDAPGAWRPLGRAIRAYRRGELDAAVRVRTDLGEDYELPVALLFADPEDIDGVEARAMELADGRTLDVGAGAGRHAAALRERGIEPTVLEPVPEAARVLEERGFGPVDAIGLFELLARAGEGPGSVDPFDTVLLLMNGAGLLRSLEGLDRFLREAGTLLTAEGRILVDSTDPRHPPDRRRDPGTPEPPPLRADGRYLGEAHLQLEFRGERGAPFPYLYVDPGTFAARARAAGWRFEVEFRAPLGRYLASLRRE